MTIFASYLWYSERIVNCELRMLKKQNKALVNNI